MKWWAVGLGGFGVLTSFAALLANGVAATSLISPVIAGVAACIAGLSWWQARRSAGVAARNEARLKFGWRVEPHPVGGRYVLRNTGTCKATTVALDGGSSYKVMGFETSTGEDGTVTIESGEARSFIAFQLFGSSGAELTISWRPEGEVEKRVWTEVLEPSSSDVADRGRDAAAKEDRDRRREDQERKNRREWQRGVLELADAWGDFKANPTDPKLKFRVQILVASLPPSIGREIGYAVDVARDVWGPGEWPLTHHVHEDDQPLVEEILPELELIWNMRTLADYVVYGPTDAMGPNAEPQIWWALQGYVARVHERESGERTTRRSRADQEHHDKAMGELRQFREEMERRAEASTTDDEA